MLSQLPVWALLKLSPEDPQADFPAEFLPVVLPFLLAALVHDLLEPLVTVLSDLLVPSHLDQLHPARSLPTGHAQLVPVHLVHSHPTSLPVDLKTLPQRNPILVSDPRALAHRTRLRLERLLRARALRAHHRRVLQMDPPLVVS